MILYSAFVSIDPIENSYNDPFSTNIGEKNVIEGRLLSYLKKMGGASTLGVLKHKSLPNEYFRIEFDKSLISKLFDFDERYGYYDKDEKIFYVNRSIIHGMSECSILISCCEVTYDRERSNIKVNL